MSDKTTDRPMCAVVWFAANPGSTMDSKEVCELTGIEPENLHGRMATSIRNGWLQRTNPGVGRGIRSVYSEGPKLRKVLGRE